MDFNHYEQLRAQVLEAAREGRATLIPAGARDNATALVAIDGQVIGQATQLCHRVRETPGQGAGTFGERLLEPLPDYRSVAR